MLGQAVRQQQQQQQQHKNLQTIYPAVINKYDEGIARINEKLHVQIEQLISAERIESPRVGSRRGTFISESTILKIKPKLLKSTLLFFYSDLISIFSFHPSFHLLTTFSRRCLLATSCHLVWHEYYLLMDLSFERLTTAFIPCFYFRVLSQQKWNTAQISRLPSLVLRKGDIDSDVNHRQWRREDINHNNWRRFISSTIRFASWKSFIWSRHSIEFN